MKIYKLKTNQKRKMKLEDVEITATDQVSVIRLTSLSQIDEEIANITERIANLKAEKIILVADRVKINLEAKKFNLNA